MKKNIKKDKGELIEFEIEGDFVITALDENQIFGKDILKGDFNHIRDLWHEADFKVQIKEMGETPLKTNDRIKVIIKKIK